MSLFPPFSPVCEPLGHFGLHGDVETDRADWQVSKGQGCCGLGSWQEAAGKVATHVFPVLFPGIEVWSQNS